METLLSLAICLFFAFFLAELSTRLSLPKVVGQILAGIILSLPLFSFLFNAEILSSITFMSSLGIIFLLLLAGLEINIPIFLKSKKEAIIISVASAIVPFLLGFGVMRLMDQTNITAIIIGACLSLTAEGTTIAILMDTNTLKSRVGNIILGAGIIDDLFEILFLILVLVLANKSIVNTSNFFIELVTFIALVYIAYKLIPKMLDYLGKEKSDIVTYSMIIILGLFMAALSQNFGFGPIIGAFIAGIIINYTEHKKDFFKDSLRDINIVTFGLIIPFFFLHIGLNFDYHVLIDNWFLTLIILIIATLGKLLGPILTMPLTKLNFKQASIIGWGMNSRGAVELVIAEIARVNNLISIELYSALVLMAVITTLMFPIALKLELKGGKKVMD